MDSNLHTLIFQELFGGFNKRVFRHIEYSKKMTFFKDNNVFSKQLINDVKQVSKLVRNLKGTGSYWFALLSEISNAFVLRINEEVLAYRFPLLSSLMIDTVQNWIPKNSYIAGSRMQQKQLIRDISGTDFCDKPEKIPYDHTTEIITRPIVENMYKQLDFTKVEKFYDYVDQQQFKEAFHSIDVEMIVAAKKLVNVFSVIDIRNQFYMGMS